MVEGRVVETTFFVRYAETDQMGVVHHAEYVVWFEEGRSAWMRAMGSNYADLEASGFDLAVRCSQHHDSARRITYLRRRACDAVGIQCDGHKRPVSAER